MTIENTRVNMRQFVSEDADGRRVECHLFWETDLSGQVSLTWQTFDAATGEPTAHAVRAPARVFAHAALVMVGRQLYDEVREFVAARIDRGGTFFAGKNRLPFSDGVPKGTPDQDTGLNRQQPDVAVLNREPHPSSVDLRSHPSPMPVKGNER